MPSRSARAARPGAAPGAPTSPGDIASGLHSSAIHLLRRLRRQDASSGLTAPRLSALSVLVFGGPRTLGDLAAAEGVRPPTMTRLVNALERQRLVRRESDPADARRTLIRATPAAEAILERGRTRRVEALEAALRRLPAGDRATLARAVEVLARVIPEL